MRITLNCEISSEVLFPSTWENVKDELSLFFIDKNYGNRILTIYSGFVCVSEQFEDFFNIRPPKLLRKEQALEFEYKLDFNIYQRMKDEEKNIYALSEFQKKAEETFKSKKIRDFDDKLFLTDFKFFLDTRLPNKILMLGEDVEM